ncbi:DNA repair protein [Lachnellula suecica]|uniref:DNA repair protein n=1 Tax=Lachnellula suecica TaxID=602035 RepID=A0A8T9C3U4_9HELO|nr:DNA repair protein [Lachnellula suecica]
MWGSSTNKQQGGFLLAADRVSEACSVGRTDGPGASDNERNRYPTNSRSLRLFVPQHQLCTSTQSPSTQTHSITIHHCALDIEIDIQIIAAERGEQSTINSPQCKTNTRCNPPFLSNLPLRSNAPVPPPNGARPPRQIRGPQSALTDFLASHNINANQIRQDANARRQAALASQQAVDAANDAPSPDSDSDPIPAPARARRNESKAQSAKRKKDEEKAIAKIKASKQFQRRRKQYNSDEEMSDEDEAARAFFEESMAPLPDQTENCEECGNRFTVTPYSRRGEDGGLLCQKCTKLLDKEEGAARKKRKITAGRQRRQIQSNLLDGIYPGAKDLMTLCIETLAKNVDLAEDFGDLPASMVERLSAILCKRRLLKPETINLFLRPGNDTVVVTDGASLSSDDYIRIFQYCPTIKYLRLRDAVQFKNKVMDHFLATNITLEKLSLHGANLIDDERWDRFFTEKGTHLKTFQLHYTDGHFGDEQLELMPKTCPNLTRLKIVHNQKVTNKGLEHIAQLSNLTHLTIGIYNPTNSPPYVKIINGVGPSLRTLCLDKAGVDDSVLEAIHTNCQNIQKLRLTDNEVLTDQGFANLFTNWYNPPLTYINLHKCRHIDSTDPRDNPDGIGFASLGFEALMAHSGKTLRYVDINSCRHISLESFERVFAADKKYPDLTFMNISFCQAVNDFVVGSIFRACPNLKTLVTFGNFGVRDVRVPKGRILIGVPTALGMQIEGTEDGEGRVAG